MRDRDAERKRSRLSDAWLSLAGGAFGGAVVAAVYLALFFRVARIETKAIR